MIDIKNAECTSERCAACSLNAAAKQTCRMVREIIDRMGATPRPERSDVHKEEVAVLVFEAIKALFIVAPSIEAAESVVFAAMTEITDKLRAAESAKIVDTVLKVIEKVYQSQPTHPTPGAPMPAATKPEIIH